MRRRSKQEIISIFSIVFLVLCLVVCFCGLSSITATATETKSAYKKGDKVTFNFVDVELPTVTKFISEVTGKNFIFDERLKGKITIIAPTKISIEDAFNLFTSVLEIKGFTVVPSGVDAYKIIPSAEVKQRGVELSKDKKLVNESYIARLIPLMNISSDDVLRFVQPMVSKDGHVSAFGPGNMLLMIDAGLNIEKILSIIEAIDKPSLREVPELVFLKYASADAVAKIINEGFMKTKPAGAQGYSDLVKAVADQRLNAVILFGDKGAKESMKSLISYLDAPSPEALGRINVYFLEHSDSTEIAKVLEGILKTALPQRQTQTGTVPVTPFEAAGGITITPDKSSNALIVVASPADYQSIANIIKKLDKRRKQVFVEALIAEVSLKNLLDLGIKWRATIEKGGKPIVIGGFGQIDQAAVQNIITGLTGLTMGGLGKYYTIPKDFISGATSDLTVPGIAVLFSLDEFKGVLNVLSTPQLLTSDNKEAEIMVGSNIPIITQRKSDTSALAGTIINSVERRDIGIMLKLTPQITEGDVVKLELYQEISRLAENESQDIIINVGPTFDKRSTKTSVAVQDGQTIVISGLIENSETETIEKVPVLGDIPLLGLLFKYKTFKREKKNLLVFITPHIIKDAEKISKITSQKERNFAVSEKRFVEGELLVKFKEGVSRERVHEIISQQEATIIKVIDEIAVYHLKLRKGQQVEDATAGFSKMPEVAYAEPNYRMKVQ